MMSNGLGEDLEERLAELDRRMERLEAALAEVQAGLVRFQDAVEIRLPDLWD